MDEKHILILDIKQIAGRLTAIRDRFGTEAINDDPDLIWMISYGFIAVGEAVGRVERLDPAFLGSHVSERVAWSKAVLTRNVLAHGYDIVDAELLVALLQNELPEILSVVTRYLAALPNKDTP